MALVKYNNNSISAITDVASSMKGAMTLIKEVTASSSATISFVHGTSDVVLDSTYPIYVFKYINAHPSADNRDLDFQVSTDTGSSYGVAMTTTYWYNYHNDGDSLAAGVEYNPYADLANGTGFFELSENVGGDNDQSGCGELWLFNPSSTTFVKHFMATTTNYSAGDYNKHGYMAGYINSTSAVDAVQFKFSADASANVDVGTFKLYGIKDS
jgi:hypothetical protein